MGFEFSIMPGRDTESSEELNRRVGYDDMMGLIEELDNAGAPIDLIEKLEGNTFILTKQECQKLFEVLLNVAQSMKDSGEDERIMVARYELLKTFKLGAENEGLSCH